MTPLVTGGQPGPTLYFEEAVEATLTQAQGWEIFPLVKWWVKSNGSFGIIVEFAQKRGMEMGDVVDLGWLDVVR